MTFPLGSLRADGGASTAATTASYPRDGKRAVRIGSGGKDRVGEGEDGAAVQHPCAVQVMVFDLHPCLRPAVGVFEHLDAEVLCEMVLINELIYVVHARFLSSQGPDSRHYNKIPYREPTVNMNFYLQIRIFWFIISAVSR